MNEIAEQIIKDRVDKLNCLLIEEQAKPDSVYNFNLIKVVIIELDWALNIVRSTNEF